LQFASQRQYTEEQVSETKSAVLNEDKKKKRPRNAAVTARMSSSDFVDRDRKIESKSQLYFVQAKTVLTDLSVRFESMRGKSVFATN